MAAIGHELVRQGPLVFFTTVQALVERLLAAKRDLRLARELRRLDRFDCLCLDDIGYVQQERAEVDVLFTLLAERYERRGRQKAPRHEPAARRLIDRRSIAACRSGQRSTTDEHRYGSGVRKPQF